MTHKHLRSKGKMGLESLRLMTVSYVYISPDFCLNRCFNENPKVTFLCVLVF